MKKKYYHHSDVTYQIDYMKSCLSESGTYGDIAAPLNIICRRDLPVTDEQVILAKKIRDKAWDIYENFGKEALTKDSFVYIQSRNLCNKVLESTTLRSDK